MPGSRCQPANGWFVLVAGWPGSGKSTRAAALAAGLGLPLLAKDEIKEALVEGLGQPVHGQVAGPAAGMRLFTRACALERTAGEGGVRSGANGPASLHRSGRARLSRWRTRRWSCRVRWRVVRSGSC